MKTKQLKAKGTIKNGLLTIKFIDEGLEVTQIQTIDSYAEIVRDLRRKDKNNEHS